MSNTVMLFNGTNGTDSELWETNGTVAGTFEISPTGSELDPRYMAVDGDDVLFVGSDWKGEFGLFVTDGTTTGTKEIGGVGSAGITNANPTGLYPEFMTNYNGVVLFSGQAGVAGDDVPGLWETNGKKGGTFEIGGAANIGISNVNASVGLTGGNPDFTPFNGVVLFTGNDAAGNVGLWETNGTASGTFELAPIAGAAVVGTPGSDVQPSFMAVLGGEVLFDGADQEDTAGSLWETNGTAAGTVEIGGEGNAGIADAPNGFTGQFTSELPIGIQPQDITTFGSEAIFAGYDASIGSNGYYTHSDSLWVTDGTAGGTTVIGGLGNAGIAGINSAADGGLFWAGSIEFPDFTAYKKEVLFVGFDSQNHVGLWETNGTAAGTVEIGGLGNAGISGGLDLNDSASPDFTVYNGKVYFNGSNSAGQTGLWVTNGTAAGTHEVFAGLSVSDLTVLTLSDNFTGGGRTISLAAVGGQANLFSTGGDWDTVNGSDGIVQLTSAQTSVSGGGDTIDFVGGSGNVASLENTGASLDTVTGSNGTVDLTNAASFVRGQGDKIHFDGAGDTVRIAGTAGIHDVVGGSGGVVILTGAQVVVNSSDDVIKLHGASSVVQHGASETFVFQPVIGEDTITGFGSTDTLKFSASDFTDFASLLKDASQVGANTVITFDAADKVTLTNVQVSSLTASEFRFD